MSEIKKGSLLNLSHTMDGSSKIVVTLQDGPKPIKAYDSNGNLFEVGGNNPYESYTVMSSGNFKSFVTDVTEEIRSQLGDDLIEELKNEIIEQISDAFFDYLATGLDKMDAAVKSIQDHQVGILLEYSIEIAEILKHMFIGIFSP